MSPLLLLRLKEHLEAALAPLKLAAKDADNKDIVVPPKVYTGDLPPKRRDFMGGVAKEKAALAKAALDQEEGYDVPCVLILPLGGHLETAQAATETVADIALICVVTTDEKGGDLAGAEADMMALLSAVAGALLPASKGEALARRFNLVADDRGRTLAWQKHREQPGYFLQAIMTSRWRFKGWE